METIKAERAQQLLRESGIEVTVEEARAILEFLNTLANIAIDVFLSPNNKYPVEN